MNPWTLIGWALLAVFAAASALILLFIAWTVIAQARLKLSGVLYHREETSSGSVES